jgi:hypothetical protein
MSKLSPFNDQDTDKYVNKLIVIILFSNIMPHFPNIKLVVLPLKIVYCPDFKLRLQMYNLEIQ